MKRLWSILCCALLLCACTAQEKTEQPKPQAKKTVAQKADEIVDVSFAAVGDNLIHGAIWYYNQKSDGTYDFKDIYEHTNPYTRNVDIAYINQETICGGTELGLSHYPSFNGP